MADVISFEDVEKFHESIETTSESILDRLEKDVVAGRKNLRIPIYLTKIRVKDLYSIYLKNKRRGFSSLKEITDYAGLRVLCLFMQDILKVNPFILKKLRNQYRLLNMEFYNWNKTDDDRRYLNSCLESLKNEYRSQTEIPTIVDGLEHDFDISLDNNEVKANIFIKTKKSGYKSIHYLYSHQVSDDHYIIEIQLRTLLQDAWAELEHSLSYKKGNIHPHIKKSFVLLARNLETDDFLMSHLKSISDKEQAGSLFSLANAGPTGYFGYERKLLPPVFVSGTRKQKFRNYMKLMLGIDPKLGKGSFSEAKHAFEELINRIERQPTEISQKKLNYFINSENAYFCFWEGKLKDAENQYRSLISDYPGQYVPHFRMGELRLIMGFPEQALVHFDKCDDIMEEEFEIQNAIKIKAKLAYVYWLLGQEYIGYAISNMEKAEQLFLDNPPRGRKKGVVHLSALINNLCFYYMEAYLQNKEDNKEDNVEYYNKAIEKLEVIIKEITKGTDSSNSYDTAAWCYYQMFIKDGNIEHLKRAKELCAEIENKTNRAVCKITSQSIQKRHVQEIVYTYNNLLEEMPGRDVQ